MTTEFLIIVELLRFAELHLNSFYDMDDPELIYIENDKYHGN